MLHFVYKCQPRLKIDFIAVTLVKFFSLQMNTINKNTFVSIVAEFYSFFFDFVLFDASKDKHILFECNSIVEKKEINSSVVVYSVE